MRDYGGKITFAPRLPSKLSYLSFRMVIRDSKIVVAIDGAKVTYRLLIGEPIELAHHGHSFLLAQHPVTLPVPKIENRIAPAQPKGRAPYRRVITEHEADGSRRGSS
jgi:alpha,alpha-trehalose phosphorylase